MRMSDIEKAAAAYVETGKWEKLEEFQCKGFDPNEVKMYYAFINGVKSDTARRYWYNEFLNDIREEDIEMDECR